MTTTTGHYEAQGGQAVVRFSRIFPHPIADVWAAVTEREQLEQWFPTTVEMSALASGAPIAFRFAQDAHPPMRGEVLTVTPEREPSFTWGEETLSFALEPADAGAACRLSLTVVMPELGKAARDSAGWESCLDMLAPVAGGQRPARPAGQGEWEAYYDAYQRLGLPATAPIPRPS
ncbi:MAG: SRPBCC family protein [Actinomycetota bacterium]|nr:SRPBCC family protein [Actinomycetota bacterium]